MKIYSQINSERLTYVLDVVFNRILGIEYQLVNKISETKENENLINYSDTKIPGSFQIIPTGLLSETSVSKQEINVQDFQEIPVIFYTGKGDLPFDIFSSVFYFLSRYEEYLDYKPDIYGRFKAEDSQAFKNGFHNLPVVEMWIKILAAKLKIDFPENTYINKLTIDIDNAWEFKNKGLIRTYGGVILSLVKFNFSEFSYRLKVISGKKQDPADTYDFLNEIQNRIKEPIQYFVLVGRDKKYDNALSIKNKNFRKLLKSIESKNKVGFHPSYKSNFSSKDLIKEYLQLCSVFVNKIIRSRQHYLKMKFPDTFQRLIQLGIREDYSLGWNSIIGFRAGMSRPYPFFDLLKNKQSHLIMVPFVAMDRSLKDYMELSPENAIKETKKLIDVIKQIGGQFTMLWHNDSLNDMGEWEGWKKVFEELIEYAEND